ncbi:MULTISPECIES: gliding motility protein RemB [unclassified Mucilaginibacter]|uniref:gliding motility protein RemB n=1 Tax=unclassified Mucilaginibacter TaxID=2617802 RepID=UPI002B2271CB|nr:MULTISPECIES: gliding motility protein RemB [unclassified Mucilaginibacter]MEB0261647.1 gliding motility protein RemB [Mucilaginibacter sp. 10I4]MEB0278512.1 gliding motility protein RemB [Mucilaginibacter sp. 10B2]
MKRIFISLTLLLVTAGIARSQSVYQPYSYDFYQKFNADAYSTKTRLHTTIKPFFVDDSLLMHRYDSIMNYGDNGSTNILYRKLFNEHLIDVKGQNSTFYADLLPDFNIGRDFSSKQNTYLNSIGMQFGGTVGKKFYYNVTGYLNRAEVPNYISNYIRQVGIAPGMAYAGSFNNKPNAYGWDYITAVVSYTPFKYINISAGRDKTFIGDGYRSLLLSDYASPYPFFKLTANLGNVKYMAMWAFLTDPAGTSDLNISRNKFGIFHYLDWNVNNRLSFGFYDSVIWAGTDDAGHSRGFDFSYINPVIFLRPIEAAGGSPDNALIGFTTKYKLTDGITAYGQFSLDEFTAKEFFHNAGYSNNKFGYQLGIRGANLFGVQNLNYLLEHNTVRPYTYSERSNILNYSTNSEPLAHPWGANFREVVALLNYSYKRFDLMGEANYGRYGLDMNGINYGKDIFRHYTTPLARDGNIIGQGLKTNMVYLQGKIGYVLNPKYNLRLELGGIYRTEKNSDFNDKTSMITFGVRSSFRQIYTDLASYKTH